ncbi:hypothetical protein [Acrocarpospora corrugata]|uniref:hypothetical protein n=1 Tax=Acrocarpospora corrugata TaxID=35763 RepID=UPI0012D2D087|nr:hypothetical protein [Acrocarpospora corrugata]
MAALLTGSPVQAPDPAFDISVTSTPNPQVPGQPFRYQVAIKNVSPGTASTDARIDWPGPWEFIPWTCGSSHGGCPVNNGVGDVDLAVTLGSGESVTFALTSLLPAEAGVLTRPDALVMSGAHGCTPFRPCSVNH